MGTSSSMPTVMNSRDADPASSRSRSMSSVQRLGGGMPRHLQRRVDADQAEQWQPRAHGDRDRGMPHPRAAVHGHVLGVVVTDRETDELAGAQDAIGGRVVGQRAVAGTL